MPENYYCMGCRLMFSVGWYHYHDFGDGYAASTLLVCRKCGNSYRIEHTLDPGKPDRLLTTRKPLYRPASRKGEPSFSELPAKAAWVECQASEGVRPQRKEQPYLPLEGVQDPLRLTLVRCINCDTQDSLAASWPEEDDVCPSCGKPMLYQWSTWIT